MSRKKNADVDKAAKGRDGAGRFAKGNGLSPGNPFHRQMAEMRQAMLDAVSPEDLKDIVRQVVVKARLGDLTAAKLVLSYVVGKPAAAVEPDRVELNEWELHSHRPAGSQMTGLMAGGLRPDLANLAVRATDLTVAKELARRLDPANSAGTPTDGGLSAGPSGGRKSPVNGKHPLESADLSIFQNLNGFPMPPQGEEGHVIDRIMAEEAEAARNGHKRKR